LPATLGANQKEETVIRRALVTGILMVSAAAVCFAADLNGRWEGSISTPQGDAQIAFNFKVDGSKLTGTVESPNGEIPIEEGKVDGDKLSFKTHFNDSVINHEGTLSGDTIDLKVEGPWGESNMTLKRAEEKKDGNKEEKKPSA
jgi:hypothetical protein